MRLSLREAMGLEIGPSQSGDEAVVAGEHDVQDGARVEVGGGEQADFGEHRLGQLLRLVDEQQRANAGVIMLGVEIA